MNIAFFVSAHGFGHAARATAVMTALRELHPDCGLEVFTRVPEWFFADALTAPFRYHAVTTDIGMVQKDPFTGDLPETLRQLDDFLPFSEPFVRQLAAGLADRGCRAVVCDISPLGIAVAKQAGVPSILVENFTWDWIYSPYVEAYPEFNPHIDALEDIYSMAEVHIQTDPVCRPMKGVAHLHPISRPPKNGVNAIRAALGSSISKPLILLTMGGVAVRHRFLEQLEAIPSMTFVVPHDVPRPSRRENVFILPHRSDFYHPDLVQTADLVIGKLGYSTLAEVGHAGKPFGYIVRKDSIESEALMAYAARHLKGQAFTEEDFSSSRWLDALDALLASKVPATPAFPNDAKRAAEMVLGSASGAKIVSHGCLLKSFDPFNDRKSRDIRNSLSEAFVSALKKQDQDVVQQEANALMAFTVEAADRHYIEDRMGRYRQVLDRVEARGIGDTKQQAIVIWNAGLFFECHDHLEMLWSNTSGRERKAFQGLIQAAGVFVHRQLGRERAAERLSGRAARLLEDYCGELDFIANIDDLIMALKRSGAEAPELKGM